MRSNSPHACVRDRQTVVHQMQQRLRARTVHQLAQQPSSAAAAAAFSVAHHPDAPHPPGHPPHPNAVVKDDAHAAEEENQELWQADWDDEETGEDFQQRLQRELGNAMKE
jgi:hypothetical protein